MHFSTSDGRITSSHIVYDANKTAIETKIDPMHNFHNIFHYTDAMDRFSVFFFLLFSVLCDERADTAVWDVWRAIDNGVDILRPLL